MKLTLAEFRRWKDKSVTLSGMSGVGKTHLASLLHTQGWFHYSGDYRIGTRYLDEQILDMVKEQAMQLPLLHDLLQKDWIYIKNNIKISDLGPVLAFVGKLGNPERGGVALSDFCRRQEAYRQAEIRAMYDVLEFMEKAKKIYRQHNFVNDAGGSLCELEDAEVIRFLLKHSLLLYITTTSKEEEQDLIDRALSDPKPLYYRASFLQEQLEHYLAMTGLEYAAQIDPDDFTRWVFPRLFHARIPRYQKMASEGYTVTSRQIAQVRDERDFIQLLEQAIASQS